MQQTPTYSPTNIPTQPPTYLLMYLPTYPTHDPDWVKWTWDRDTGQSGTDKNLFSTHARQAGNWRDTTAVVTPMRKVSGY